MTPRRGARDDDQGTAAGGEASERRSMRSAWRSIVDEEPPARGMAELLAAARRKADEMAAAGGAPAATEDTVAIAEDAAEPAAGALSAAAERVASRALELQRGGADSARAAAVERVATRAAATVATSVPAGRPRWITGARRSAWLAFAAAVVLVGVGVLASHDRGPTVQGRAAATDDRVESRPKGLALMRASGSGPADDATVRPGWAASRSDAPGPSAQPVIAARANERTASATTEKEEQVRPTTASAHDPVATRAAVLASDQDAHGVVAVAVDHGSAVTSSALARKPPEAAGAAVDESGKTSAVAVERTEPGGRRGPVVDGPMGELEAGDPFAAARTPALEQLRSQCEAAAGRGECPAVRSLVDQIVKRDRGYKARLAPDSAVARCLAP